ncbi:MAG: translation initiation factor IF-2 [Peptostreptococcaceae bacterium]|nr:translation initiation factor IF-2 [Peptostreptococcaceae bacterium]
MKKIRIYELAKDLHLSSKDLVEMLNSLGFDIKNHMGSVTEQEAQQMMRKLAQASRSAKSSAGANKPKQEDIKAEDKKAQEKPEEKKVDRTEPTEEHKTEKKQTQEVSEAEKKETKIDKKVESERPLQQMSKEKESSVDLDQGKDKSHREMHREKGDGTHKGAQDRKFRDHRDNRNQSRQQDRQQDRPQGDRKHHSDNRKDYQGDRRPNAQQGQGERRSYQGQRQQSGDKKPYQKSFGDKGAPKRDFAQSKDKDFGDRKPIKKDFKRDSKPDPTKEELSIQIKKEEKRKELKIEEKKKLKDKKKVDNRFESGEVKYQRRDLSKKTHTKKKKDKTKHHMTEEDIQVFDGSIEDGMFVIGEDITVGKLADILKVQATEVIMKLMKMGIMASINQDIRFETAEKIAEEYNILLMQQEIEEEDIFEMEIEEDDPEDLLPRAPIVTVMGHVDHGKTTLLDTIRSTGVALKEAGGITQHIGASEVMVNGQKIVFLDTPGHEAFTEMRARGAKVTDVAIVVVAADDGIMPQTVEAINHVRAANVPMIIAINKIDKPAANIEKVRQELSGYNVLVESWGGDVADVPVSAKAGEGIDKLLEMVLLVAEMEELKANPNRKAVGSVIESNLDKGRGAVATILVQNGTLKVGDAVVAGASYGKVRAMINSKGNKTGKAGPSTAVEILGLNEVPNAGDPFVAVESDKVARDIAEKRKEKIREDYMKATSKIHLEDLFSQMQEGSVKELNLIIKADVQGSIEALKGSLEKISNEEVIVRVIHGGVGAITESDVMLASASNAIIIGFNVRPTTGAVSLAEKEQVDIRSYSIIYQAIEEIETAMKGMLAPKYVEEQLGTAQVRMVFKVPGAGFAAGSYVTNGKITRNAQVRLVRDGIVIYDGKIDSLRRFKDEVKEVATGFECGISLERYSDIKENDIIEAYEMKEVKR